MAVTSVSTCPATSAHMGPKTKSAHLLRWHYGERVTMGQFSNSFPKRFSYLCEYAFRFDLSCSFCEYPIIFHCVHCSPSCFDPESLLLAYYWLGLSWIDLDLLYFNKQKLFISKNKQQETLHQQQAAGETKHSAETTINLSGSRGSLSLRTGSNPVPYIQCAEYRHI